MSSAKKSKRGSKDGKGSPNKLDTTETAEPDASAAEKVEEVADLNQDKDADKNSQEQHQEGDGQSVENEPEPVYEEPILTQLIVDRYTYIHYLSKSFFTII